MPSRDMATVRSAVALIAALCFTVGCIPYTVASTADPAEPGERQVTAAWFAIPDAADNLGDTTRSQPLFSADAEVRWGMDDRSDLGLRLTSGSGIVVNYKRRLDAASGTDRTAFAAMGGLGLVNLGSHAHFELTLLASGPERRLTPYGGLRAMQVAPLSRGAVHDSPTLGGFLGIRIGDKDMAISPEVAVYYDRSALGLRERNIIVVPAIAAHGEELIRLIGLVLGAIR